MKYAATFISDLHLNPQQPIITEQFINESVEAKAAL